MNFIQNLRKVRVPIFSSLNVAIDLGTTNIRVGIRDKGITLDEPTVVGRNSKSNEYVFFGNEAKTIMGKVPDFIKIERPIVNSIISSFDGTVALLEKNLQRSVMPYLSAYPFLKPGIHMHAVVPSTATEIEQKAVEEVLQKCGASEVSIYEKAVVTGIGCGFNIFVHHPVCIIDMGGGIIEISILSGGGVVLQKTLKTAGEHMNKIIYNYLYLKHGIMIGENSCEELKINLANFTTEDKMMLVRGKSLETGLPKSVKVRSSDVKESLLTSFNHILDAMKEVVELAPPEVVDELYKNGVILTGGLAQIPGLDAFFSAELNLPVKIAEQKQHATINGILKVCRRAEQVHKLRIQLP